jgi:hypothetical protein
MQMTARGSPPTDRQPTLVRGAFRLAVATALFAAGCGGDAVRVTGRLVQDGQPYAVDLQVAQPDTLAVDFVGTVGGTRYLFPATMKSDGTFSVAGSNKAGIPRGQYKITVLHSGFEGAGGDRFKGRYTAEQTPLTVDITENTDLTIDLGTGTVTK